MKAVTALALVALPFLASTQAVKPPLAMPSSGLKPTLLMESSAFKETPTSLAVSATGKFAAAACKNVLQLLDTTAKTSRSQDFDSDIKAVAFVGDDQLLIVFSDGLIEFLDCKSLEKVKGFQTKDDMQYPRINASGTKLYYASFPKGVMGKEHWSLVCVDLDTREVAFSVPNFGIGGDYCPFADDAKVLGTSSNFDSAAEQFNTTFRSYTVEGKSFSDLKMLVDYVKYGDKDVMSDFTSIALSPDNSLGACCTYSTGLIHQASSLETFNLDSGLVKRKYQMDGQPLQHLGFLPDGRHVVMDTMLEVSCYDLRKGEFDFKLPSMSWPVTSRSSNVIAAISQHSIRVYSLE